MDNNSRNRYKMNLDPHYFSEEMLPVSVGGLHNQKPGYGLQAQEGNKETKVFTLFDKLLFKTIFIQFISRTVYISSLFFLFYISSF